VDPFAAAFMTAALACAALHWTRGGARWALLGGLAVGLALACKVSAAPALVLPLAAIALRAWRGPAGRVSRPRGAVALGAATLLAAAAGLALGDPFALLDAGTYAGVLRDQVAINGGAIDQWFARKYVGTPVVLYPLGQLLLLGAGPLVGLAGATGAAWLAIRPGRARGGAALLALGGGAYFVSIAFQELKWLRYLVPLTPYLCLCAAVAVVGAAGRGRAGALAAGALLLSAALGALAFVAIYTVEHPQIQAARWIYAHAPRGSRIGLEKTAIGQPLPLPGRRRPQDEYRIFSFDVLADQPSPDASAMLRDALRHADYLVVDTTQAALTVPRLPWRYPVQIRYYDLLKEGALGFAPALTATAYPSLLGVAIPDDAPWVDASFRDASHPTVVVYHKTRDLSDADWAALFADAVRQPSIPTRQAP
jgi:hypothetical protein